MQIWDRDDLQDIRAPMEFKFHSGNDTINCRGTARHMKHFSRRKGTERLRCGALAGGVRLKATEPTQQAA
jgi:hypothetical protein